MSACRYFCCRDLRVRTAAYALGLLGSALAGPAALENAALNVEAYAQLVGDFDTYYVSDVFDDAAEIVRGREP